MDVLYTVAHEIKFNIQPNDTGVVTSPRKKNSLKGKCDAGSFFKVPKL